MAVQIDFLANVAKFLRGTDDVEGALDDVAGSLDDVAAEAQRKGDRMGEALSDGVDGGVRDATGRIGDVGDALDEQARSTAGSRIGDELAGGVRDGGGKAESALDSVEAKFRDLASASQRESSSVGGSISKSVKHGSEEASEGVKTLKENTGSNLKEVAASFDGTFSGVAGGAQGLVAEIAEGFGPAGLLAGAIGAGAIGLLSSGIEGADAQTQQMRADVGDLARQMIDAGTKGRRSFEDAGNAIEDLATESDPARVNLAKLFDDAKASGNNYQQVVEAIASGDPVLLAHVKASVDGLAGSHVQSAIEAAGYGRTAQGAAQKTGAATKELSKELGAQERTARAAADAQEAAAKAGLTEFRLKAKAIEQVQGAYADAAGSVDDYIDKESGLFDVAKYLRAMQKRQEALRDYAETLEKSNISPEARSYIESLGEDQAAAMIAGYKGASKRQREQLDDVWSASGRSNARSYTDALGDDLRDYRVKPPRLYAPDDDEYIAAVKAAQRKAQQYLRDHPLQAGAVAYTSYGKPIF